jgi:hypothetical protein
MKEIKKKRRKKNETRNEYWKMERKCEQERTYRNLEEKEYRNGKI